MKPEEEKYHFELSSIILLPNERFAIRCFRILCSSCSKVLAKEFHLEQMRHKNLLAVGDIGLIEGVDLLEHVIAGRYGQVSRKQIAATAYHLDCSPPFWGALPGTAPHAPACSDSV